MKMDVRKIGKTFMGPWKPASRYAAGSFVTFKSKLWLAEAASLGSRPGDDPTAWRLIYQNAYGRKA